MLYSYNEIKTVHLEITERCNAACPQCNRNINGGEVNQHLGNHELSLENIKNIFSVDFLQQLDHIYMCGNFGDPIAAQDSLECFEYFRNSNSNILLSLNTNGSARTTEWWTKLAKILGNKGYVIFSIDGLEDTNHIYRKNTNWNKIIENAQAFIKAGGIAHWEFIVFEHNEHQVEQAEQYAYEIGFKKFQYKKTARFMSSLTGSIRNDVKLIDRKGNLFNLSMPKNEKYRNEGLQIYTEQTFGTFLLPTSYEEIQDRLNREILSQNPNIQLYDKADISCKVKKEKSIFISAEGIVQPCCWVASTMYSWFYTYKGTQIWKLINKVGIDKINAHLYSIKDIVEGDYFKKLISESWEKDSCKNGKLAICAKTCGKDLETFTKQYT